MEKVIKAINAVNNFFGNVSGWLSLLMAFLITFEVVFRYIFNAPTMWSMEVNQYLFCAITLLGGGYCLLKDGHVRVDLFYPKFSPKTMAIVDMCTFPLALIFCAILVWMGGSEFWAALVEHKRSDTVMAFPLWPVWLTVPLGGFLLVMQIVARYLRHVHTLVGKN
jgi:TRAP-type mannitol/chloroaromatic compound transport system permease small subunit